MKYFFAFLLTTYYLLLTTPIALAISDPLAVPNNKFGIHIIQATPDESSPAAQLVNTNGDWGYITFLIESKDRNHNKWQEFFNDLRRRHLIPLVRLATQPEDNFWKRPYEGEEQAWADFLDVLNWPVKNRYIIIYNEPNHAKEWGNSVDVKSYAEVLDKTITALKSKNQDFFVLNAGFDASAPSISPKYEEQAIFMKEMNKAVPGIFKMLDGWVSHSYPNPNFTGSPSASGRGTVNTWQWEKELLKQYGVENLPVFITETGWKHAEGINFDKSLPNVETVCQYYKQAFQDCWSDRQIVAVTPFLLSYQEAPFDHFSFKKITGEKQNEKILGVENPDSEYYPTYHTLQDLPKVKGQPLQDKKFELKKGEIYKSIVAGENYTILLTFKNTGQSIWNDREQVSLMSVKGGHELGLEKISIPKNVKVEPGQEYTFRLPLKAPRSGSFNIALNLFEGQTVFDSPALEFTTEVKSPVIIKIIGRLNWKNDFSGSYKLNIKGENGQDSTNISLNKQGISDNTEIKFLLPDYTYEFSLEKPFYYPSLLKQEVHQGENILDFGLLKPNIFSALLHPMQFWNLLPFSK